MITPRWTARIMLALSGPPQRYSELADKLPWLQSGQLHPKLTSLCDAGLAERTEHSARHVTYGHTGRGAALLPVLPVIAAWADEHLETADRPPAAIEQIEDSLTLLTRRHAAAILWALKIRGASSGRALARLVMPGNDWTNIYPPLRQLVSDGLAATGGNGQPYRLTAAGDGLGPVLGALSAWSAGQPLDQAARHPVWGTQQAAPAQKPWASSSPRPPRTAPPQPRTGEPATPAWHHRDLFSHPPATAPATRPAMPTTAGGPRR
ncbi:helix-turn-helix transcriptional regulator [Streptomyces acidiscabies]|uniref:Winged helix-turn-helix transcriptional regulator n=2 Tax=Streptomyces acidiscabies TaxID=42234 RepID=A0AAP6EK25_9ACTN|nr:winged helix-turn-helix transcriptional regulator [Streptomyces acidiscabies]MBZ3916748.1 helix-turn-helix transcriptional regulator [Streptomyces acidiscabies]MDX2965614.1 winged helix-turn-helix transcriptional regulator [Streptomyces acidiscabies]MDX3024884.1 winged helix-turn-helix transcriptional regulator [Streptomyces acidiscabies]MDX3795530.1 winged helix-turn-helix transcriptional regulator [Streptomyces acidiscabies]